MSGATSPAWAIATQTGVELRLTARRGENLLAMVGIPAVILLLFGTTAILPAPATGSRVDALLPGTLSLAIIATGLVNLGIATAYERGYGVLKRLGGSPLGRSGVIAAKILTILIIEFVLLAVLVGLAVAVLGWRPPGPIDWPVLVAAVILGTATFAGFGLALAGAVRPEATLVLANILFLLALAVGGVLVPVDGLPPPIGTVAAFFPPAILTDALRIGLGAPGDPVVVLALGAWALFAVLLAIRAFHWD
ncbi:MAG TPA: ABC transporter permease [Candidatus Limnocylindrales bacterium]|jgi:ABC-2 type transport system permease protein|nr:ABC transporter permease [Candidatus Limnocylindrales bacterium]